MIKEENLRKAHEFLVEWCKQNDIRLFILPDSVLDVLQCMVDYKDKSTAIPPLPDFKTIREEKSLTLKDVEKAIGVNNSYLSQLERGKIKNPSYATVKKLDHFYNEA